MAIFYQTGTLNPLSTQLAEDIRQAFKTGMDAAIAAGKTKWSVAEHDYVNGTGRRTVYNNTEGFSLMLINSTTLSNTALYFYLGQSYTLATHTLNNVGFGSDSNITSNASGFTGVNYNPTAPNTSVAAHTNTYLFTATSSQTDWSIHVENEYVYFSFKDGSVNNGQWLFAGKHISMVGNSALTDDYPFSMTVNTINRNMVLLHSLNNNSVSIVHRGARWSLPQNTPAADLAYYDKFSANPNKAKLSPIYISRQDNTIPPSNSSLYGWLRGKMPEIYNSNGVNGALWGDTISISGKTYMYIGGATTSGANIIGWVAV